MTPSLQTRGCPSPAELAAFNEGNLADPALESLAEHLAECPSCQEALQALVETPGTLAATLRLLKDEAPDKDEPTEGELLILEGEALALARKGMPAGPAAAPPSQLREYQLLEKLGQGGMGAVYRAVHTRL